MQATELPFPYSQWLLNRSNHFGEWPEANFVFTTELFHSSGISGKSWVNAFSSCLPESSFPRAKFVAQAIVIYSELLLFVSGFLPKLACCPSAGFLYICEHVYKIKDPASHSLELPCSTSVTASTQAWFEDLLKRCSLHGQKLGSINDKAHCNSESINCFPLKPHNYCIQPLLSLRKYCHFVFLDQTQDRKQRRG